MASWVRVNNWPGGQKRPCFLGFIKHSTISWSRKQLLCSTVHWGSPSQELCAAVGARYKAIKLLECVQRRPTKAAKDLEDKAFKSSWDHFVHLGKGKVEDCPYQRLQPPHSGQWRRLLCYSGNQDMRKWNEDSSEEIHTGHKEIVLHLESEWSLEQVSQGTGYSTKPVRV